MNLYDMNKKACMVLMSSILVVSCGETTETGMQTGNGAAEPAPSTTTKSSGPTVALSSEQVEVNQGETFSLDITMSDFPVSEGGGVTVNFDPGLLNVNSVNINAETWTFVNKVGGTDNDSGVVSDILFSSYKGVSGDNTVATITFTAVASGSGQISLQASSINPFASNGDKIAVNFQDTNVQVVSTAVN